MLMCVFLYDRPTANEGINVKVELVLDMIVSPNSALVIPGEPDLTVLDCC